MDESLFKDHGPEVLSLIARFHGISADPVQIRHRSGEGSGPLEVAQIVRAARDLGLRARAIRPAISELARLPLPAVARHKDGHYLVLARVEGDNALIHDVRIGRPIQLSLEDLETQLSGELVLVTRREALLDTTQRFGLRWFVPVIMRHKRLLGEVLLASLFIQLFALITPLFFQVMIDKVLVHEGRSTLHVLAIGLLAVSLFDVLLNILRSYVFSHTTSRIDVVLAARLFDHLSRLPISYFKARRVGDTVARVRELDTIREFITGSSVTLVIDLLFTVVFFAVLFLYNTTLALVVLASIPCYVLLSVAITPALRVRIEEKFRRGAENQAFIVETVTGMDTLKSMAVEPQMQRRWEDQIAAYVTASFRAMNLGNIAGQTASFINKVVTVLILWIGAGLVMSGAMTIGMLIAFNMIAGRISGPILRLVQLWQDFQQAGISLQRLGDVLNAPTEPGHDPNRTSLPDLKGEIRFDHVTFSYHPDRPPVLQEVDLTLRAGEVIGIVGRSGSGKSTLTRMVQRLYVPNAGRVLVDGVDLALVDPAWLRRQVGVVLQDSFLFNRSVRDNIALAEPGAPMERIIHAAKLAGAHEFILELPQGYDTPVGEQASLLSGGQRQRIAIARALLANPRILIFDEATSALDYESEHIIQRNMAHICRGRTVLIIAHRLSTVRQTNRIVVMDRGRIVETGNHDTLLANKGLYAHLHALQSGHPSPVPPPQGATSTEIAS
ncbi:type I secretion system permease/ATPase [Ectothiorhodospira shaposhnikovii]|uniref:type I secretion system permease/ATPase n=1 Tax=Ectothiorhodospira shaposhnikovii TaxID=1054 RepID=UPI0019032B1A|nr:type I secretion system permease/ATPase [Ectothiorhodospira shaposhnikovii]MBK1674303.1 type I secretion system permease/ATPase [Ectothiorhodospira shaposhnikovii]